MLSKRISLLIKGEARVGEAKWLSTYRKGELSCERLGDAHLPHHGIHPIKSSATGERTDPAVRVPYNGDRSAHRSRSRAQAARAAGWASAGPCSESSLRSFWRARKTCTPTVFLEISSSREICS